MVESRRAEHLPLEEKKGWIVMYYYWLLFVLECIAKRIKIYERFNVPQVAVEEMTFILKTLDVGVGGKERLNLISRAYPRRIVCPISFMISVFVILILLFPDPGLWYYTGYVVVVCLLDSLSLASFLVLSPSIFCCFFYVLLIDYYYIMLCTMRGFD